MNKVNLANLLNDKYELSKKEMIDDFLEMYKSILDNMDEKEVKEIIISELNFQERGQLMSCRNYDLLIKEGDICYIDFGKAYNQETGYMHFGLVIKIFNSKALVIPMTSNPLAYCNAYDEKLNPSGMTHLMRIGKIEGLVKYSVLFLNDAKFINTARIISVKSHLSTTGQLYNKILNRFYEIIQ